jgi:hypothetical protein
MCSCSRRSMRTSVPRNNSDKPKDHENENSPASVDGMFPP